MRILTFLVVFICSLHIYCQKTDVVVISNGDEITGELKSMKNNVLKLSTDDMGIISIKWDKVLHVISNHTFQLQIIGGDLIFGSLDSTSLDGYVRVLSNSVWTEVKAEDLVGISRLNQTIIGRIDGNVSVGYSYTKSSDVHSFNGKLNVSYLANRNLTEIGTSAILTNQQDTIYTSNSSFLLSQTRLFDKNWFFTGSYSLQQNTELGIKLRSLISLAYGKHLIKKNDMVLQISTGLASNSEEYYENEQGQIPNDASNLEGLVKIEFQYFSNNEPEFNIHPYVILYPGLTEWGRFRSDLKIDLKFEIIHNLFFTTTFYNQLDTKNEQESKVDYGVITSFGFSF